MESTQRTACYFTVGFLFSLELRDNETTPQCNARLPLPLELTVQSAR